MPWPAGGVRAAPRRHRRRMAAGVLAPARGGKQRGGRRRAGLDLQHQAWQWALVNRAADGSLPRGKVIGAQYGRHERWGRLVKRLGATGSLADAA